MFLQGLLLYHGNRMNSSRQYIRDRAARMLVNYAPGILYYLAGKSVRKLYHLAVTPGWIDIVDEATARRIRLGRQNAVYTLDMMNAFEYYHGSATPVDVKCGRKQYRVVDFSTPRFQEVTGFSDFPIMCPSLTEPYITAQQYLDFACLQPGDVVIDLGAYSALTSIAFSKAVGGTGKVIALEPDPVNFRACATNLAYHKTINGLQNVALMQAAVSSKKEVINFSSESAMGSAEVDIVGSYRGNIVQVDALGLGEIADLYKLGRIDFIKMDIEGAEEKVIASSRLLFETYRPKIIIEPHKVNGAMSTTPIIRLLEAYDYKCDVIVQIGAEGALVVGTPKERLGLSKG
jgi:FkbM family methyltransferase